MGIHECDAVQLNDFVWEQVDAYLAANVFPGTNDTGLNYDKSDIQEPIEGASIYLIAHEANCMRIVILAVLQKVGTQMLPTIKRALKHAQEFDEINGCIGYFLESYEVFVDLRQELTIDCLDESTPEELLELAANGDIAAKEYLEEATSLVALAEDVLQLGLPEKAWYPESREEDLYRPTLEEYLESPFI